MNAQNSSLSKKNSLLIASIFLIVQVASALFFAPASDDPKTYYPTRTPRGWVFSPSRYMRLNNWDSFHYYETAQRGYYLPSHSVTESDIQDFRATGGFFPGFPVLVRVFHALTGASTELSLILVSQCAAWIFWIYFFLLCRLWKISERLSLLAGVIVLIYPASFFLVAGYSESLFLASMLGMIYWMEKADAEKERSQSKLKHTVFSCFSGLHGFALCSTRLLGLPFSGLPILRECFKRKPVWPFAVLISFMTAMGVFLFFFYCYLQFGRWDHYIIMQKLGWAHHPSYLSFLNPLPYIPRFFFEPEIVILNKSSALLCMIFGASLFFSDREKKSRVGYYSCAFAILYLSISAKANTSMDSLCRYGYGPFILFVLILFQRLNAEKKLALFFKKRWLMSTLGVFAILFLIFNGVLAYRFTHGKWVT